MSFKGWEALTVRLEETTAISKELTESLEWVMRRLCTSPVNCPVDEHRKAYNVIEKAREYHAS